MNLNPVHPIRRAVEWVEDHESRKWLDTSCGCCTCGTGGPYYEGTAPQVTRYLYVGVTACGNEPDWSSCSAHPLPGVTPVVVTFRQTEADTARALAGRQASPSSMADASADAYRVRVHAGRPARTLRHPRPRWGWLVQIDHVSRWAEHGDAEQLNGGDWFASQGEATEWGVAEAARIHARAGCDECRWLEIPQRGELEIHVGPEVILGRDLLAGAR